MYIVQTFDHYDESRDIEVFKPLAVFTDYFDAADYAHHQQNGPELQACWVVSADPTKCPGTGQAVYLN